MMGKLCPDCAEFPEYCYCGGANRSKKIPPPLVSTGAVHRHEWVPAYTAYGAGQVATVYRCALPFCNARKQLGP